MLFRGGTRTRQRSRIARAKVSIRSGLGPHSRYAARACAQLHLAESAARPGARDRYRDDREGIPLGAEFGTAAPRGYGSGSAEDEAHHTKRQGMLHGPVGSEARSQVAARDAVDDAIGRREQEEPVGHRLAPGWKD